jgi:hypothetical protein
MWWGKPFDEICFPLHSGQVFGWGKALLTCHRNMYVTSTQIALQCLKVCCWKLAILTQLWPFHFQASLRNHVPPGSHPQVTEQIINDNNLQLRTITQWNYELLININNEIKNYWSNVLNLVPIFKGNESISWSHRSRGRVWKNGLT